MLQKKFLILYIFLILSQLKSYSQEQNYTEKNSFEFKISDKNPRTEDKKENSNTGKNYEIQRSTKNEMPYTIDNTSFLEESESVKSYFEGIGIGAGIGFDLIDGFSKSNTKNSNAIANDINTSKLFGDQLRNGGLLFVNTDYACVFFQKIFLSLGMEFGYRGLGNYSEAKSITGSGYNYDINRSASIPFNFGVIFKIGYIFEERNLIYTLFGYDLSRINMQYQTVTSNVTTNEMVQNDYSSKNNALLNGYRFGIGYERIIFTKGNVNVSANIEAYYKHYFGTKINLGQSYGDLNIGSLNGLNIRTGIRIRFDLFSF